MSARRANHGEEEVRKLKGCKREFVLEVSCEEGGAGCKKAVRQGCMPMISMVQAGC